MHWSLHVLSLLVLFLAGSFWGTNRHRAVRFTGHTDISMAPAAAAAEPEGAARPLQMDTIMLLGDSLTQGGWEPGGVAQRLAYVYARKMDVVNRGLSGYNAEWALPVFEQVFPRTDQQAYAPKVKLLTIWFGANDACLPPKVQHTPLPRFIANLHTLLTLIQSPSSAHYSPHTRIILITPPPFSALQRGAILAARDPPQPLDRAHEVTRAYARAVLQVGEERGVPVVDMWERLWDAAGRTQEGLGRFLHDGLHVNADAYGILFEEIISVVGTHYPELHPDKLPMVFAHWEEMIDNPNPEATLRARYVDV